MTREVARFGEGRGADVLRWYYTNSQGSAILLDVSGGTGDSYTLSSQDMH